MQTSSSQSVGTCFLDHQLVRPAAGVMIVAFLGLAGWIGSSHLDSAAERLDTSSLGNRPMLGIRVIAPDELVARMFSFPPGESLMVSEVVDQSLAQRVGLRRGDGIVAVQGRSVGSPAEFADVLSRVKQGELLQLTVVRGGLVHNVMMPTQVQPGG